MSLEKQQQNHLITERLFSLLLRMSHLIRAADVLLIGSLSK